MLDPPVVPNFLSKFILVDIIISGLNMFCRVQNLKNIFDLVF
jgi:hypothetical protein